MKKLIAFLLSVCMVSAFAVPAFADANSDYIAAVKAYQAQVAAKEAAYTAAVQSAAKQAQAKADAEVAAVIAAGQAAQAKADAEVSAVIAAAQMSRIVIKSVNCAKKRRKGPFFFLRRSSFLPYVFKRFSASSAESPHSFVWSAERDSSADNV